MPHAKPCLPLFLASCLSLVLCQAQGRANEPVQPLVDLDARSLIPSSSVVWINRGTLGDFAPLGEPQRVTLQGVEAVAFDGVDDAYGGPRSIASIEGAAAPPAPVAIEIQGTRWWYICAEEPQ